MSDANVRIIKSAKLFYNKYPYKISYVRLYGFPQTHHSSGIPISMLSPTLQNTMDWWFDIPKTEDDRQRRSNCLLFLNGLTGIKFMNSGYTHVYFETKEEFDKARVRYTDLQDENYIPILDNLAEIIANQDTNIDVKAKLYHRKFRYKVSLRFDQNLEERLGPSLFELYHDNSNYHLNPNLLRFDPLHDGTRTSYSGYTYHFRHSLYNSYVIYCKEYIDMQLLTFVAGENISKITKAVLIDEIDK